MLPGLVQTAFIHIYGDGERDIFIHHYIYIYTYIPILYPTSCGLTPRIFTSGTTGNPKAVRRVSAAELFAKTAQPIVWRLCGTQRCTQDRKKY